STKPTTNCFRSSCRPGGFAFYTSHLQRIEALASMRFSLAALHPGSKFAPMILVIDNYDSFTYNLVQYLGELNAPLEVRRNDEITLEQARELKPDRILVSPGPCSPKESGLSNDIIRTFSKEIPVFGVCLGHQCIGHTFGAEVVVNYRMMHGKTSMIKHNGKDLFEGMPNPFPATRYHSLVIKRESMPDCLEVTAET